MKVFSILTQKSGVSLKGIPCNAQQSLKLVLVELLADDAAVRRRGAEVAVLAPGLAGGPADVVEALGVASGAALQLGAAVDRQVGQLDPDLMWVCCLL